MKENLKKAIEKLNKSFGNNTVTNFEDKSIETERISTGSLGLDNKTGGGYPCGRIIEIYGPESSGKTTLAIHAIAECHKLNKVAAFIDAEHAFDPNYAENIGVKVSNPELFLFSQPSNGEEAIEIARELVKSGEVSVIVIDSVAALTPKAEIDGETGDAKMGLQARLMSQAMRVLVSDIQRTNTVVIFLNQLRDKIGVMFGNPETTTGGNALKFYASLRLDVRRIGTNKEGDEAVSNKVKVKTVKNKTFPPFKQTEFDIVFGVGIDRMKEIIDLAVEMEIICKKGSWFSYGDTKLGQGSESVRKILTDNPELLEEIESKLK